MKINFYFFSSKIYVVGTKKNCLSESNQNKYMFLLVGKKVITFLRSKKVSFYVPMIDYERVVGEFVFNVPPTAKVIWRCERGFGLCRMCIIKV